MLWREIDGFSSGSVCLALASAYYDEADYYRDYLEFQQTSRALPDLPPRRVPAAAMPSCPRTTHCATDTPRARCGPGKHVHALHDVQSRCRSGSAPRDAAAAPT